MKPSEWAQFGVFLIFVSLLITLVSVINPYSPWPAQLTASLVLLGFSMILLGAVYLLEDLVNKNKK